jgi:hypothetical protein
MYAVLIPNRSSGEAARVASVSALMPSAERRESKIPIPGVGPRAS